MKQFNESFYTGDFGQEMIDFVEENLRSQNDCNLGDLYLRYGKIGKGFWTTSTSPLKSFGKHLTKNQFKEKIGMTNKDQSETTTFTKSMLKSGEHIVETREGIRYLVAGGMLINLNGYQPLGSYEDNLEFKNIPLMSIDKVYSGRDHTCEGCLTQDIKEYHAGEGFKDYINQDNLTLIWERESPEQKEKRLQKEKLKLKLQELQKECKLVEDEIMKLGD